MQFERRAYPLLWFAFYAALLVAAIGFADALDDYATGQQDVSWQRAAAPLYAVAVLALAVFGALSYARYGEAKRAIERSAKRADNDDDDAAPSAVVHYRLWLMWQASELSTDAAFVLLGVAQVFFLQAFLEGETSNVVVDFLPLIFGLYLYVMILCAGAVRTCGERRSESSRQPFVAALCCLSPCMRKRVRQLEQTADDERRERNTQSAPQISATYEARAAYQDDSRVYICVPDAVPAEFMEERCEVVFGWVRLVLCIVALSLALVHAAQVSALERPLAKQLAHCEDLPEICAAVALAHFVMPADAAALYQRFGVINGRLLHSLTTWREARVLPIAVAFLPLFLWYAVYFLLLLPTAVGYWRQRKRVRAWLELVARIVANVFALLFLAVLAAHVDGGVLEGRNWHTTFAPAYCALIVLLLIAGARLVRPPAERKCATLSRYGLCVYRPAE